MPIIKYIWVWPARFKKTSESEMSGPEGSLKVGVQSPLGLVVILYHIGVIFAIKELVSRLNIC